MTSGSFPVPARGAAVPLLAGLTATLDRGACWTCVALFMAILVTMVLQVAFRYALGAPLTWREELARYLYIWACYLGAPVALRRGNHLAITVVAERLPPRVARLITLSIQGVALFFLGGLAIQGTLLALRAHTVMAITLPIPWSAIYLAAPVSAVLMVLETLETVWKSLGRSPVETPP